MPVYWKTLPQEKPSRWREWMTVPKPAERRPAQLLLFNKPFGVLCQFRGGVRWRVGHWRLAGLQPGQWRSVAPPAGFS